MKKQILALVFFCALLKIAFSQVYFQGQEEITLYAGESKTIDYYLTNLDNKNQTFVLFVSGFYIEGIAIDVYPKILTLAPNQTQKVTLYLEAKKFVRETLPTSFSLNIKYENQTIEKNFILRVLRKYPVYIYSLNLSSYGIYPLESLKIKTIVENVENRITPNYKVNFTIFYQGKEVFNKLDITDYIPARSKLEISEDFYATQYQKAGKYDVVVQLLTLNNELIDEAKSAFEVKPIEKIPENFTKKESKYSLLEVYTRIEVKNEGNVVSKPFYLIESLPSFMKDFFNPLVPPTEIEYSTGYVNYKWLIKPLQPGESVIIEYKVSLWQAWIAIVLIILAVIFFFRKSYAPSIKKEVAREGKKLKVYIKIKNYSKKPMKEIVVRDYVPQMFKISSYFGVKPEEAEVKKRKEKELTWKITELKEDEEAIFGYYLEPLVEIVSAKIESATLEFLDHKGNKVLIKSNEVSLK